RRSSAWPAGTAERLPWLSHVVFFVVAERTVRIPVAARRRHDDELLVFAAGQLDEFLHYSRPFNRSPADDQQGSVYRSVLRCLLGECRYAADQQQHECSKRLR